MSSTRAVNIYIFYFNYIAAEIYETTTTTTTSTSGVAQDTHAHTHTKHTLVITVHCGARSRRIVGNKKKYDVRARGRPMPKPVETAKTRRANGGVMPVGTYFNNNNNNITVGAS